MSERIPKKVNAIVQTILDYLDIKSEFKELVDLEKKLVYSHFMFNNYTDATVVIKFLNVVVESEVIVASKVKVVFDSFEHWDSVKIKYITEPSKGNVVHYSW